MELGGLRVSTDSPPFVIAEMSGNHNGSLERALAIVEAAARAGAHALKLQTYTPDTMTLDLCGGEFVIDDVDSPWTGQTLFELYRKAHTPWEWHEQIFRRARECGMVAFSTPFDESAVDFLESLDVPCYKIASPENVDLPLIRKVGSAGKPMFISTGMATLEELEEALVTAREAGAPEVVLLKCTSAYPASTADSNLVTLTHMRGHFGCEVGLSDHTVDNAAAIASVALGATVIEKHLTLDRSDGGVDSAFSLEPRELAQLVRETRQAWQALGSVKYGPTEAERVSVKYRRSIYVVEDLRRGDLLTGRNLRCIRPGLGLAPKHYDTVLGKAVNQAVKRGTPLGWEMVD